MNKKIFKNSLAVSVVALILCIVAVFLCLGKYFVKVIEKELKEEASILVQLAGDDDAFFSALTDLENRITLIDGEGNVLYDSDVDNATLENHADREEFIQAVESGEAYVVRYSDTLSVRTIYYAVLLDDGSVLRVSHEEKVVLILLQGIVLPFVMIFLLIVIIVYLMSRYFSKKIVQPINAINPDDDNLEEPYPELAPLVQKLRRQSRHIEQQMNDIKRQQREFMAITENMNEGFLIIDNNTEILSYNTAIMDIFGDGQKEAPRMAFELNRSPEFRTAVEEALLGKGNEQKIELQNRVYSVIANPVMDHENIVGAVVIVLDVTEKEEREQYRREFTSNVSHELRTPLSTIYGVSDMMVAGIVKPEDMTMFAKTINDEAGRMNQLIDDITQISKLDEGSDVYKAEDVDLYDVANEVIGRLLVKASERNISMYLIGTHAVIHGDESLCNEIVFNICENAIKYNKENGTVRVLVLETPEEVTLTVEDTGIGIPSEYQDRIFERFFRVDQSHSSKVPGTGLGLSIVKHAAARMNARLEVDSEEGVGTAISVIFQK